MRHIVPTNWQTQAKIFEAYGCVFKPQKGSHLVFHCPGARRAVVIPKHKEVSVAVIRSNMRTAGMSKQNYFELTNI